ncbi:MAG: PLxRFG domain-containing protein, partial [Actinobacteria bacterium]|nr:PLxRFG domain-containing protein [Actinomycetota bacterium]
VLAAESPTGKRVWNVTGPDGEILGTFDKKGDATTQATQARVAARTAAGLQPAGRKATLTPEQRAAATGQRAVTQKASIDATRTAEKLLNNIGEEYTPNPESTQEEAGVEKLAYDDRRVAIVALALDIANDPAHRLNTAGQTAKQVLAHPSVTQRERALAANELRKARGEKPIVMDEAALAKIFPAQQATSEKPQSSGIPLGVTNENSNAKYTTFKNAGQALSWVSRNGTKFEKFLAKRLYYFARKAQIVIASDMNALPEAVRKEFETGSAGVYFKNVIYLHPVHGINNTVFLHEALHGATIAKITEYLTRLQNGESIPPAMQAAYLALETVRLRASDRYFLLKEEKLLDDRMQVFEEGGAFSDLKEFIAYGLSSEVMHEFLLQTSGILGGKTANYFNNLLSNFVKGIRGIFNMGDTHQSALQDLILATDNLLSTRMRVRKTATAPPSSALPPSTPAKKLKQKVAKVSKAIAQIQASSNEQDVVDGISTGMAGRMAEDWLPLLKDNYAAFNVGTIQQVLYKLPTSDIIRWKGDEVPGLKRVDTLVQRMAAMRGTMEAAGAKKATELAKFVRKNGQKVIGEAMHLARLHEVSPTKYANRADALANDPGIKENAAKSVDPKYSATQQRTYKGEVTKRTRAINEVFTAWEALGKQPGGHSMYKMVRQFYIDSYNLTRTLLNSQIQALPIDAAAKAKLMKSVRLMQEQGEAIVAVTGKKRDALPEEYFPFMRYGENWLRVTTKGGSLAGRAFYTFESAADRNTFQRQEATRLGKDPEDASVFSTGSDLTSLRKDFADASVMLKEMFSAIDKATTSSTISSAADVDAFKADVDAFKEGLKDQLYQVYLLTLPERSLRKQFLNAKNITGFSADIFRNFKTSATKLANQASKLRYATEIQNEVIAARESLAGRPPSEVEKLSLFVNEIAWRANEELNPTPRSKLAAAVSQFAFLMLLTSGASAMVQFASIPVMVMPRLNRDYGYEKSAAKFARYMPIWDTVGVTTTEPNGDVTYSAPSIGTSKMVTSNPVLQRAFEEAVNRQVTTVGNVSIITNNRPTPANTRRYAATAAAESAYGLITGLFSGAERLTREMTYMMAFELEYAKTKDFDASVEKAIEVTQDTLFRYDTMERPRILRTGLGSTVGQFKMYAAGMTSFFIRNMYHSMRIWNPKEALPAIHLLSGVLLTGAVFHGLAGSPFYSTIATLIDLILNAGDEDEEKKKRRQKDPLTAQSSDLRFRYEFLPEQFGKIMMPGIDGRKYELSTVLEKGLVSVLTDVNVGSRTSFNNMWFRSYHEGKDWKETAFNIAEANLGPSVSAGGSFISGVEDVWNGKIRRGLEKMVPAFFKGSIVASRYADEGAQTRDRKVILERNEISGLNLAAQVLGFTPTRLAEIQEYNYSMKEVEVKATKEKNDLLKDFKDLENNPDRTPEARKKLNHRIDQHNRRYNYVEELTIDEDTLERSLEAYEERKQKTIRGLYRSEELGYYINKTDPYLRQQR